MRIRKVQNEATLQVQHITGPIGPRSGTRFLERPRVAVQFWDTRQNPGGAHESDTRAKSAGLPSQP